MKGNIMPADAAPFIYAIIGVFAVFAVVLAWQSVVSK
jgi:hypothetical protein